MVDPELRDRRYTFPPIPKRPKGYHNIRKTRRVIDVVTVEEPYMDEGMILPNGWFVPVPSMSHAEWCYENGTSHQTAERWGFIFMRAWEGKISWTADLRPTEEQLATLTKWCHGRGKRLRDVIDPDCYELIEEA